MKNIIDVTQKDVICVCKAPTKMADGKCFYEDQCGRATIIYELLCLKTGKSYIGKTQDYLRVRIYQHITSVWKPIEHQKKNIERKKNNKEETDMKFNVTAMSKHFAKLCWDCTSSNQVRTKMKTLMSPTIIWQGNRIKCMKTAMTNSCKLCMVEKLEIMKRYSTNQAKLINNNSDIFASCTCNENFARSKPLNNPTLMTGLAQKKVY